MSKKNAFIWLFIIYFGFCEPTLHETRNFFQNPHALDDQLLKETRNIIKGYLDQKFQAHQTDFSDHVTEYRGILSKYYPYNLPEINCFSMDINDCKTLFELGFQLKIKLNWHQQDPCTFYEDKLHDDSDIDSDIDSDTETIQQEFFKIVECSDAEDGKKKITKLHLEEIPNRKRSHLDWNLIIQLDELKFLTLRSLNLQGRIELDKVPSSLKYLYVDYNEFNQIIYPNDPEKLGLRHLCLGSNKIDGVLDIDRMPNSLQLLSGYNNLIERITYPRMESQLDRILLGRNKINMKIELNKFPHTLEILELFSNRIIGVEWDELRNELPSLWHLDLRGNHIKQQNAVAIILPPDLFSIELDGNSLHWDYSERNYRDHIVRTIFIDSNLDSDEHTRKKQKIEHF